MSEIRHVLEIGTAVGYTKKFILSCGEHPMVSKMTLRKGVIVGTHPRIGHWALVSWEDSADGEPQPIAWDHICPEHSTRVYETPFGWYENLKRPRSESSPSVGSSHNLMTRFPGGDGLYLCEHYVEMLRPCRCTECAREGFA